MQIEPSFVNLAMATVVGLQAWILKEVVTLKVTVATLTADQINMKNQIAKRAAACVLLPLLSFLFFSGCASPGADSFSAGVRKALGFPGVVLDTVGKSVTTVATNVTSLPVVSSATSVGLDPLTSLTVTNTIWQTNLTYVTNYTVSVAPGIEKTTETVKQVSSFLPSPWGDAIAGGATALAVLAGNLARRRQKQLESQDKHIDSLRDDVQNSENQLQSVIIGVEKAVKESKPVKETIAKIAAKNGVSDKLAQSVAAVTAPY